LGFHHFFPQFSEVFAPDAEYWFRAYAEYLCCDEHTSQWVVLMTDTEAALQLSAITMQQQVLQWGNKLLLLKQAAPSDVQAKLDVDAVTTFLNSVAQLSLAKRQIFSPANADLLAQVSEFTYYVFREH
jgi:hypothetical protein